jgi:hypothetical protein
MSLPWLYGLADERARPRAHTTSQKSLRHPANRRFDSSMGMVQIRWRSRNSGLPHSYSLPLFEGENSHHNFSGRIREAPESLISGTSLAEKLAGGTRRRQRTGLAIG